MYTSMYGFEMQNNAFKRHSWRFIYVYSSKVMILVENILILNKSQAEYNIATFNTIFGIDVNDVKYFKS